MYDASCWNAADLALLVLNLGAYLPLHGLHVSISFEDGWRLVNVMQVLLTFVKINLSLKIFDSSSFLVQMVRGVFHDFCLFLACYTMVFTTFGILLMVHFDDSNSKSQGLGPLTFIIMSFCILWGEYSFEIEKML